MGLADELASKVKPKGGEETPAPEEAKLEAGDAGKRALAAIKAGDASALEAAIRDCVDSEY